MFGSDATCDEFMPGNEASSDSDSEGGQMNVHQHAGTSYSTFKHQDLVPMTGWCAAAKRKRAASPIADVDTTIVKKSQRLRRNTNAPSSKRVRASDYALFERHLISKACTFYGMLISTKEPFPTAEEELKMVRQAYDYACRDSDVEIELDSKLVKLVCIVFLDGQIALTKFLSGDRARCDYSW